jgi:hypothetical protein
MRPSSKTSNTTCTTGAESEYRPSREPAVLGLWGRRTWHQCVQSRVNWLAGLRVSLCHPPATLVRPPCRTGGGVSWQIVHVRIKALPEVRGGLLHMEVVVRRHLQEDLIML